MPGDRGEHFLGSCKTAHRLRTPSFKFQRRLYDIESAYLEAQDQARAHYLSGRRRDQWGGGGFEFATEDSNDIAKLEAYDHHDDLRK